ncbi:transposase [Porphyromonas macacae]|uniref:transposase n=1 Tax=Porphyromonas macacae TaxID=28115 RepID=UPI00036AE386|nr:transposase [Porphyromonas macacae]
MAEGREDGRSDEARTQEEASHYELKSSKPGIDSEALWVRKGKSYRYGYKKHVLTDEQGLVEAVISTAANCGPTRLFCPI